MNRAELAGRISAILNVDEDFSSTVWHKSGLVRVYLRVNSGGKKGWVEKGHIEILPSGEIQMQDELKHTLRYSRPLLTAIQALPSAEPETAEKVAADEAARKQYGRVKHAEELGIDSEDSASDLARSAQAIAHLESSHEQG